MNRKKENAGPVKKIPFLQLALQNNRLKKKILRAWEQTLHESKFILGPQVHLLEREIAALCGATQGIGVNSGTDALLLALKALELKPGDEVIVPDFTFVATASAVLLAGAVPVLADIEPGTYCLSPAAVQAALTRRTKAMIPVHLYGQPANMTALMSLARRHRLAVVEDACQALGATWHGKPVGALGDAGCLSFFPTKNLGGTGDGGMVVTRNEKLAARIRRLRNHGSSEKYLHQELGYNSRLDEMEAAVLRVKLPYLKAWNARRQKLAAGFSKQLAQTPLTLPQVRAHAGHVFHQYAVMSDVRDALRDYLTRAGIENAVHYPLALHQQPMLKSLPSARRRFPVSEMAARRVLCLPITPELTNPEAAQVVSAILKFFKGGWA